MIVNGFEENKDEVKEVRRMTFRDFIEFSIDNIKKIETNIIYIVRELYSDGLDIDELQKRLDDAMFGDCFFRCADNQLTHISVIGEIASKLHDSIIDGSSELEPCNATDGTTKSVPSLFNNTIHNIYGELISVREYLSPVLQAFDFAKYDKLNVGLKKDNDEILDAIHDFCDIFAVEEEIIRILSAIIETIGTEDNGTCVCK